MVEKTSNVKKLLGALVVLSGGGWALASVFPSASNQGYMPTQPIPYSHKLHAGELKIQCMYCHSGVEKSKHANVPSVGVCMNCHKVVKTDSPLIQQIAEAYENDRPIEWVRVHELPDFVHFPHNRHVSVGLKCQECHGPIQEMEVVYQYAPMTMGWCMECHRGRTTPEAVKANVLSRPDRVRDLGDRWDNNHGNLVAPINCTTCHK
jgi:hypothetical protein